MANERLVFSVELDESQVVENLARIEKSLTDLQKEQKAYREAAKAGDEEAAKEYVRTTQRIKEVRQEQRQLNNAFASLRATPGSYKSIQSRVSALTDALKGMNREADAETFDKVAKDLEDANAQLRAFNTTIGDNRALVGSYSEQIVAAFDKIKGGAGGAAQGFASGGVLGAVSGLAGSIPQLALVAPFIGQISESLNVAITDFVKLRGEIQTLTGESGAALSELTANVRATAETFGKENEEIFLSANALAKQFGITTQEALEVINKGFLAGADTGGEFLDTVKEYSTQFKAAGLSASEFVAITAETAKQGIFSDKGVDTIKEAGLRLRENTKATSDALKVLGKEANDAIAQAIGEGRTFDAIKLVSAALNDTALTAQQTQTIIADVFGGAGEDAGLAFLQGIKNINVELDGQINLQNELTRRQAATLEVQKEYQRSLEELSRVFGDSSSESANFFTQIKTLGVDALLFMIDIFKQFLTVFRPLQDSFRNLFGETEKAKASFKGLGEFLQGTFSIFLSFQKSLYIFLATLIDIIVAIGRFVGSFEIVQRAIATIVNDTNDLIRVFKEMPLFLAGFVAVFKQSFIEIADIAKATFKAISDGAKAALKLDGEGVKKSFAGVTNEFKQSGKDLSKAFSDAYKQASAEAQADLLESEIAADKERTAARAAEAEKAAAALAAKTKEQRLKDLQDLKAYYERIALISQEGSFKQLQARIAALNTERDIELENVEFTQNQRLLIIAKANAEELKLRKENLKQFLPLEIKETKLAADTNVATISKANDAVTKNTAKTTTQINAEKERQRKEDLDKTIEYLNQTAQVTREVGGALTTIFEAQKQEELRAAGDNAKKREQIERKFARKQQVISSTQTVIETAQGVATAYARAELFPFNIVLAGLVAAQGAAQLAIINGQKFAAGGYTGSGYGKPDSTGYKPAGLVHEKEFVFDAVSTERIGVDNLYAMQHNALMGRNLENMRLNGYANGGYVGQVSGQSVINNFYNTQAIAQSVAQANIVVRVTDINTVQGRVATVTDNATLS